MEGWEDWENREARRFIEDYEAYQKQNMQIVAEGLRLEELEIFYEGLKEEFQLPTPTGELLLPPEPMEFGYTNYKEQEDIIERRYRIPSYLRTRWHCWLSWGPRTPKYSLGRYELLWLTPGDYAVEVVGEIEGREWMFVVWLDGAGDYFCSRVLFALNSALQEEMAEREVQNEEARCRL